MSEARERIKDLLIEEEMRESYLTFAMSVIVSRALPRVEDGLKPSQRRILVAMNDLNLGPRAKFRKAAKIGVPSALVVGAAAGVAAGIVSSRRHRR